MVKQLKQKSEREGTNSRETVPATRTVKLTVIAFVYFSRAPSTRSPPSTRTSEGDIEGIGSKHPEKPGGSDRQRVD